MQRSLRTATCPFALLLSACLLSSQAQALVINPIFADSYTGQDFGIGPVVSLDGNVAAENAIAFATKQIASQYSDNVTVNILFYGAHDTPNGFLGASVSGQTAYSYAQYTDALAADALANKTNTALSTAVANLGFGNGAAGDPAATFVIPTTPDARALGLGLGVPTAFGTGDSTPQFDSTGDYLGGGGTIDAIVFLNLDQPLTYTRPIPGVADGIFFDAKTVMEHETDEVLGIGGAGSTLNDLLVDPNFASDFFGVSGAAFGPMDLYRYAAPGVPSYVANPNLDFSQFAYFSIDGGNTFIDSFNQQAMIFGDAADWGLAQVCDGGIFLGGSGGVQDAFSCNNHMADVTRNSPEDFALQAIGYDRIPEPLTLSMFGAGLAGAVALHRRRKKPA
jgi:hypothetical protein